MICNNCGTENLDSALFCVKCGCRLDNAIPEQIVVEKKEPKIRTPEQIKKRKIKLKIARKYAFFSGCGTLFLTFVILLTFLFFVPVGRQNKIQKLIDSGDYTTASALIEKNDDYGKGKELLAMCNAGKAFERNDFESGIDYICNVGGTVYVQYDPSGGSIRIYNEIIKKFNGITNIAEKDGFIFNTWLQTNYSLKSKKLSCNLTLKASLISNEDIYKINHGIIPSITSYGKFITYGMYPQTNVNDYSLISTLDTLSNPNEYGYYIYNNEYYYKYSATPYTSRYKFDNGSTITSGTNYWFKVEPIKWKILANEDGAYFLTTESLLINHRYHASSNNYINSEIRSWLNTDFYNQAFFLDNDYIKVSEVDNSVSSTGYSSNSYACENTNDKLFLLSYKELTNTNYGFCSDYSNCDIARRCKTTDYARAHGTCIDTRADYDQNGLYHTRSPGNDDLGYVLRVGIDGVIGVSSYVGITNYGVRPALRLSL